MQVRLNREFRFEAAHRLTSVAPEHRCGRLHGHSYKVELALEGQVDERAGWLIDFAEIDRAWGGASDKLDHAILNDIEGLANPTCEHLTRWIWLAVAPRLPGLKRVTVWETADARCEYEGKD
jgi:6-pyruvoyltetrahydropterin/6-carboxytetrahydropterin synthase